MMGDGLKRVLHVVLAALVAAVLVLVGSTWTLDWFLASQLRREVCDAYPQYSRDKAFFERYAYPYPFIAKKAEDPSVGGIEELRLLIVGWSGFETEVAPDGGTAMETYTFDFPAFGGTTIHVRYDVRTGTVLGVDEVGGAVKVDCGARPSNE